MGDRCYLSMSFRKKDEEAVNRIMTQLVCDNWYDEIENSTPHCVTVSVHEANYAYDDELEQLAKAGIAFTAYNAEGCNYPAGLTAAAEGERIQSRSDSDGFPYVTVNDDGSICQEELDVVHLYQRLKKQLDALIDEDIQQDFSWLKQANLPT